MEKQPSAYESFFDLGSFGVVGRSKVKPFPLLSYRGLKAKGKKVYAIDPSSDSIDGDKAYPSLAALPEPVEGLIVEVPKAETKDWVAAAAEAGIRDVWVHMAHDTPEAVALAKEKGIHLRTGTCAVMYLAPTLSYHGIHKLIMKLTGKY
ncbi:CoA-binding protein [Thiohalocapsa marina]|uniref:CoA-binding protein n=1 Tax=Thiohalocapsa marina TaxID=424902 RepID=A0A5M8FGH3_9GAMM|nr:CoA-binding protein [Thiohalocapsa marina]KAA6182161.1 CoA-binding protein [Thiohalocapsa marina]